MKRQEGEKGPEQKQTWGEDTRTHTHTLALTYARTHGIQASYISTDSGIVLCFIRSWPLCFLSTLLGDKNQPLPLQQSP